MLQRLKHLYRKLNSGTGLLSGRLRSYDQELAQLRAAIAALTVEAPGMDPKQKDAARAKLEGLLAYQGDAKQEIERLAALYESSAARVAAAEMEISDLRKKLQSLEKASR